MPARCGFYGLRVRLSTCAYLCTYACMCACACEPSLVHMGVRMGVVALVRALVRVRKRRRVCASAGACLESAVQTKARACVDGRGRA
eukprot:5961555-Pleurochrysis_carterae.AAC.1